ncbi:MAG: acetyltransferase [Acidimicrobiales bacterium]
MVPPLGQDPQLITNMEKAENRGPGREGGQAVIFGAGTLAELVDHHLTVDSAYDVVAFTATADRLGGGSFLRRPLVPFDEVARRYPPAEHRMFVAVGYDRMNRLRSRFYDEARAMGYRMLTYVSSRAVVQTGAVGDNCLILAGAIVEPFATIGHDVILWSGAHVSHHSSIGDHSFVGPGAAVAGHTSIGRRCFLGIHATVRDGVTVADDCLVGAGATVLDDTEPGQVLAGTAARPYEGDVSRFYDS